MQNDLPLHHRIVSGQMGLWAVPLRGMLRLVEVGYAGVVNLRNRRFDRRGPSITLPVPVISVGNLSVGGAGKTPFVVELIHRLDAAGFSPAVVSRGYGAIAGEPNDEERLIQGSCPSVICVSDSDRAAAARTAHERYGADVIVLDDAFQHRRLARSLDIVLVDATNPFGYGHMLPRGLLREPVSALGRADVIVLTRADQATSVSLRSMETRIRRVSPRAVLLQCRHAPTATTYLDGTPYEDNLEGKRAVITAGIGQPRAFANTCRSLGVEVVGVCWWPDHHHYRTRDINRLFRAGRFPPYDVVLTTEKDAVKLSALPGVNPRSFVVVKIAIDFMGDGSTILQTVLDRIPKQDADG